MRPSGGGSRPDRGCTRSEECRQWQAGFHPERGDIANFAVFFFRLYYPWPYNLHLLAGAWLVIAVTLGMVVAGAVFAGGRITYHRIVGAILLYLLIAVAFATLFAFVGLSISESFKGIEFRDDLALASSVFYLSFVTLTSTGYGDIVPVHPLARSLWSG